MRLRLPTDGQVANFFLALTWCMGVFAIALACCACATPGEVVQVVETVRSGERDEDRALMAEAVQPQIAAVADALEDYKSDNADTTGRAIERIAHEALDRDEAIKGSFASQSALTASVRAELRRDSERRDHALGLRLDRHKAANEGSSRSMLADVKILRAIAATAGVTAGSNASRLSSMERRVEAEADRDATDKAAFIALLDKHKVAVGGDIDKKEEERTKKDDARVAKIQAELLDMGKSLAALGLGVFVVGGWIWSRVIKKRA